MYFCSRKREYKIKNLEAECAKIAAKEKSEGGLTQGQASTLVRNERALDALREELEELEDQMTDCITDSIKGKQVRWNNCGYVIVVFMLHACEGLNYVLYCAACSRE